MEWRQKTWEPFKPNLKLIQCNAFHFLRVLNAKNREMMLQQQEGLLKHFSYWNTNIRLKMCKGIGTVVSSSKHRAVSAPLHRLQKGLWVACHSPMLWILNHGCTKPGSQVFFRQNFVRLCLTFVHTLYGTSMMLHILCVEFSEVS